MLKKMLSDIFDFTIRGWHGRSHYEYQRDICQAILKGFEDTRRGIQVTIPIEVPRQSGKTTSIVDVTEFLMACGFYVVGKPIPIGIFAPQSEQATTDFDRLKIQFGQIMGPLGLKTKMVSKKDDNNPVFPDKWNSKTVRVFNARGDFISEVYIFPLSKNSKIESKTFMIILVEEGQDVDDEILKNRVLPMGSSTNALRVIIGTAGTRNCFFKEQLDNNPRAIRIKLQKVFDDRRKVYEETGDASHLFYEKFIKNEIIEHGEQSDYVQRQYFSKWLIGTGQFVTVEDIEALTGDHGLITENKPDKKGRLSNCYVGIDTAKAPDETWVTVIRDTPGMDDKHSQLCTWLVLKGENYENQFYIIKDWLSQFEGIRALAVDSTGQGDFMPDMFQNHTSYNIIRAKFSLELKDVLYKGLLQVVQNKLTTVPNVPMDSNYRSWRAQLLQLEKEYKGRYMSVHHPNDAKAHDDAPDSWALAEYAKTEYQRNAPRLSFL